MSCDCVVSVESSPRGGWGENKGEILGKEGYSAGQASRAVPPALQVRGRRRWGRRRRPSSHPGKTSRSDRHTGAALHAAGNTQLPLTQLSHAPCLLQQNHTQTIPRAHRVNPLEPFAWRAYLSSWKTRRLGTLAIVAFKLHLLLFYLWPSELWRLVIL